MIDIIVGGVIGLIGALAARLIWAKTAADVGGFGCLRQLILGAIAGGIYAAMRVQYGVPDGIITFVAGYAGSDFIEAIVARGEGQL